MNRTSFLFPFSRLMACPLAINEIVFLFIKAKTLLVINKL